MRGLWTVTKRELRGYLTSPVAYVLVAVFLMVSGYFFYNLLWWFHTQSMAQSQNPYYVQQLNINRFVYEPFLQNVSVILLLIFPLLTMRLWAEEKRGKTDELLLTSPVSTTALVGGKFLGAIFILLTLILFLQVFTLFGFLYSRPEPVPLLLGYGGLFCMGLAFIAIGFFTSTLTENQMVAASLSFGILLLLWVLSWGAEGASPFLRELLTYLSFFEHYKDMPRGIFNIIDPVYYLSVTLFFLCLGRRVIESRRWR